MLAPGNVRPNASSLLIAAGSIALVILLATLPKALPLTPHRVASDYAAKFVPPLATCAVEKYLVTNGHLPNGLVDLANWSAAQGEFDSGTYTFTCAGGGKAPRGSIGSSGPPTAPTAASVRAYAASFDPPLAECAVQRFVQAHNRLPNGFAEFTTWSTEQHLIDPTTGQSMC